MSTAVIHVFLYIYTLHSKLTFYIDFTTFTVDNVERKSQTYYTNLFFIKTLVFYELKLLFLYFFLYFYSFIDISSPNNHIYLGLVAVVTHNYVFLVFLSFFPLSVFFLSFSFILMSEKERPKLY